ncbi:MAG: serine/threonine protein kinase [Myxococcales bacterium]|nr:serine/threonine protein kinase [Myxococcales bacterium]MCB9577593.1 serine/threonine protein kinase [Polyangiaceae bacterium]
MARDLPDPTDVKRPTGDPLEGTPYRTVSRLGEGGMGAVYLAEHDLGRTVVVKVVHPSHAPDREDLVERLALEARSLGRLTHRNVVEVLDFGRTPSGRPYLVMEWLKGHTLAQELKARPAIPVLEAIDFARQALAGLGAAHALGVVHRDVKPTNLFLCSPTDAGRILKVLDFGIAKVLEGISDNAPAPLGFRTDGHAVIGTPRYVSPEQAALKSVDHRSDIYSLALVLYTMIAGRGPFDHTKNVIELLAAHRMQLPAAPSRFAPDPVPAELDAAVLRGLAKRKDERFQSADEFSAALGQIAVRLRGPIGSVGTIAVHRSELVSDSEVARGQAVLADNNDSTDRGVPFTPLAMPPRALGPAPLREPSASDALPVHDGKTDPIVEPDAQPVRASNSDVGGRTPGTLLSAAQQEPVRPPESSGAHEPSASREPSLSRGGFALVVLLSVFLLGLAALAMTRL